MFWQTSQLCQREPVISLLPVPKSHFGQNQQSVYLDFSWNSLPPYILKDAFRKVFCWLFFFPAGSWNGNSSVSRVYRWRAEGDVFLWKNPICSVLWFSWKVWGFLWCTNVVRWWNAVPANGHIVKALHSPLGAMGMYFISSGSIFGNRVFIQWEFVHHSFRLNQYDSKGNPRTDSSLQEAH